MRTCYLVKNVVWRARYVFLCAVMAVIFTLATGVAQASFTDEYLTRFPTSGTVVTGEYVHWGDYNNDGFVDFSVYGRLFKNNSGSIFTFDGFSGDAWGDYNNDGLMDSYESYSNQQLHRNLSTASSTSFDNPISMPNLPAGVDVSNGTNRSSCWGDFDKDGFLDLYVAGSQASESGPIWPDVILTNNDANSFTSTSIGSPNAYARGVTTCDWDEDGDLDIYVCNYYWVANRLWQNDGAGNFSEMAADFNVAGDPNAFEYGNGASIGAAWGDLNNDGHFDLVVTNLNHLDYRKAEYSMVYGNLGAANFEEKFIFDEPDWVESYASVALGDYDNDANMDIFLTAVYSNDCRLYKNNGDWTFSNVTAAQFSGSPLYASGQAGWADFDNDGDLDLVTGGGIYVNDASSNGNHWLKVRVSGMGTQVRIDLGGGKILTRQVESSTGENNGNDPTLHFGLGGNTGPVTVEIKWLSGTTTTIETEVDRTLIVGGIPSDADGDGYVNLIDYSIVAGDWQRCNNPNDSNCEPAGLPEILCDSENLFSLTEDFNGMVTADLSAAPWSAPVQWGGHTPSPTIATGLGGNGTNVLNLALEDDALLSNISGPGIGTVEFDLYLENTGSQPWLRTAVRDDAGWAIAYMNFANHGGDTAGIDLALGESSSSPSLDLLAANEWAHIKIDYDCSLELFDVTVTSPTYGTQVAYKNQSFWGAGSGHAFSTLGELFWFHIGGGARAQIEDIEVSGRCPTITAEWEPNTIPEPPNSVDFEDMNTADLDVTPWSVSTGTPTVVTPGLGGNSSKVLQLELNDQEVFHPSNAGATGTVEFDLYLEKDGTDKTIQDLLLTDNGWMMAYIRFSWGWGGAADGVDITLHQGGSSPVLDVMAYNEWTHIKLDYDATVLGAETFDLTVSSPSQGTQLVYDDQLFWEYQYGHDYTGGPSDIRWYASGGASGPRNQIDNVQIPTGINSYSISGDTGVGGVTLTGLPGTVVSDSNGLYSAEVAIGSAGTVIPKRLGYQFTPSVKYYSAVTQNMTGQDYAAEQVTCQDLQERMLGIPGDVSGDCYVTIDDIARLADEWLLCNKIGDPLCQ